MSTARQALKRPAPLDSDDEDSDVIDLCSSSSGDEAAGGTGSTAADGDATVTEDSDAEPGAAARLQAAILVYSLFFVSSCRSCCASCSASAISGFDAAV